MTRIGEQLACLPFHNALGRWVVWSHLEGMVAGTFVIVGLFFGRNAAPVRIEGCLVRITQPVTVLVTIATFSMSATGWYARLMGFARQEGSGHGRRLEAGTGVWAATGAGPKYSIWVVNGHYITHI